MVSIVWFWRTNSFTLFFFPKYHLQVRFEIYWTGFIPLAFCRFCMEKQGRKLRFRGQQLFRLGAWKVWGQDYWKRKHPDWAAKWNVNLENPFSGRITCLQMWKKFLSKEQIEEIYKGNDAKDGKCQTNDDSYRFLTWAQVKTANTKGEVTFHWPSELIWSPSTAVSYS